MSWMTTTPALRATPPTGRGIDSQDSASVASRVEISPVGGPDLGSRAVFSLLSANVVASGRSGERVGYGTGVGGHEEFPSLLEGWQPAGLTGWSPGPCTGLVDHPGAGAPPLQGRGIDPHDSGAVGSTTPALRATPPQEGNFVRGGAPSEGNFGRGTHGEGNMTPATARPRYRLVRFWPPRQPARRAFTPAPQRALDIEASLK